METFDFAEVAVANFGGREGTLGAASEALIAETLRNNDGDRGEHAREFVFKKFVLGPRIEPVENNAFLTSRDEIFGFGNGLTANPIVAFSITDHFAELALGLGSDFDATFFHFFINHATKVDFRDAALREIVDNGGFTAAAHAKDGKEFNVFVVLHIWNDYSIFRR